MTRNNSFMKPLQKLLSISGGPLSRQPVKINLPEFGNFGSLGNELVELLTDRNGFYAFESALHVFPASSYEGEMTLSRWNSFGLWRNEYGVLAEGMLFFAENALGDQFCIHEGLVCNFDAETGEIKSLGKTLAEWAQSVLQNYKFLTAYPLLHQWQLKEGALPVGMRLMPKIPFVFGGGFTLENLYPINAVRGMKSRGNLAKQIKDLPDGTQIKFRVIE